MAARDIPKRLVRLADVRVGDLVQVNTKAKPTKVVEVKKPAGKVIITLSTTEVRTYAPDDRIIRHDANLGRIR